MNPGWSRRVQALDADGERRDWHLLDTHAGVDVPAGTPTLLCVHGNPTWSHLWRGFLASAPAGWRVVAIDQLGMGWSDRLPGARTLALRIDDLDTVARALGLLDATAGPLVLIAHDWGGPISLGWAERLVDTGRLRGIVLGNTAVHQPASFAPPALIRLARSRPLLALSTVATPAFVRGTTALSRPALPRSTRDEFAAPYRGAARRQAVGDFVADIPFEPDHPSRATLDTIADGLDRLAGVPMLLLWGARDPVFTERHLADLLRRLPHADVQRYPGASHLVFEDAPASIGHAWSWIRTLGLTPNDAAESTVSDADADPDVGQVAAPVTPLWSTLADRADDDRVAMVELVAGRPVEAVSFAGLAARVADLAAGLAAIGVRSGDRVGLLVPPGIDLTAVVYACWRVGAVIVVSDAGLGLRSLGNALRSAAPDHLIAVPAGLAAARALRVPGRRIVVGELLRTARRLLRVRASLADIERLGRISPPPRTEDLDASAEAAVLFTSGATGPPKGVVYRFDQLHRQLDQIRSLAGLSADDRLVAAFAPFALYGPALGIPAAVPAMDVTKPGTLTAQALADAVAAVGATVVFASPAALKNVVATAPALSTSARAALAGLRLLLSAGAPVAVELLSAVATVLPNAELHTPYGMTEAMPVADTSLAEIVRAEATTGVGAGVYVGHPRPGVEVAVAALRPDGSSADELTREPGISGEICVRAGHVKERYDKLWAVEAHSSRTPGWHRTGDVGQLDADSGLRVEGRLTHVVLTADGPRAPVGAEQSVERLEGVDQAAVVGVGPAGVQQVVVVLVPTDRRSRSVLAGTVLAETELGDRVRTAVRAATSMEISAVLVTDRLPTDVRHNSKIDRTRVARWAERVLAGGRVGRP